MNHELEKEIVKGTIADLAVMNAESHNVTMPELAQILREIADRLQA